MPFAWPSGSSVLTELEYKDFWLSSDLIHLHSSSCFTQAEEDYSNIQAFLCGGLEKAESKVGERGQPCNRTATPTIEVPLTGGFCTLGSSEEEVMDNDVSDYIWVLGSRQP